VGAWAESAEGAVLFEISKRIPDCTNNEAEYQALLEGLRRLHELGYANEEVEVRADSELLMRQMRREYRVKAPHLQPLFAAAQAAAAQFSSIRFVSVPREHNGRADALANAAFRSSPNPPDSDSQIGDQEWRAAARRLEHCARRARRAVDEGDADRAARAAEESVVAAQALLALIEKP
jgi:ribonuclease HI